MTPAVLHYTKLRSVVERTFGWIKRASRFAKDFEGDHRVRARLAPHSPPDYKSRPAVARDWQEKSGNWPNITGTTPEP